MEKDGSLRKRIIGLRLTVKEYEQIERGAERAQLKR
jgi:hypothetical protein